MCSRIDLQKGMLITFFSKFFLPFLIHFSSTHNCLLWSSYIERNFLFIRLFCGWSSDPLRHTQTLKILQWRIYWAIWHLSFSSNHPVCKLSMDRESLSFEEVHLTWSNQKQWKAMSETKKKTVAWSNPADCRTTDLKSHCNVIVQFCTQNQRNGKIRLIQRRWVWTRSSSEIAVRLQSQLVTQVTSY